MWLTWERVCCEVLVCRIVKLGERRGTDGGSSHREWDYEALGQTGEMLDIKPVKMVVPQTVEASPG